MCRFLSLVLYLDLGLCLSLGGLSWCLRLGLRLRLRLRLRALSLRLHLRLRLSFRK